jgi:RNA polymerase sigma-54 factor
VLIRAEDPHKPLSDQQIMDKLKSSGLPVARRTVAKYREALGFLPSHLRKSF